MQKEIRISEGFIEMRHRVRLKDLGSIGFRADLRVANTFSALF